MRGMLLQGGGNCCGSKSTEVGPTQISCKPFDWQLSSLVQLCGSLSPVSTLECLDIRICSDSYSRERQPQRQEQWQDDTESTQWLELCNAFTSVRHLRLSGYLVPLIAPALKELGEMLPALENISSWEPQPSGATRKAIEQFASVMVRLLCCLFQQGLQRSWGFQGSQGFGDLG